MGATVRHIPTAWVPHTPLQGPDSARLAPQLALLLARASPPPAPGFLPPGSFRGPRAPSLSLGARGAPWPLRSTLSTCPALPMSRRLGERRRRGARHVSSSTLTTLGSLGQHGLTAMFHPAAQHSAHGASWTSRVRVSGSDQSPTRYAVPAEAEDLLRVSNVPPGLFNPYRWFLFTSGPVTHLHGRGRASASAGTI